jgi:hypothetical protein
MENMNQRLCIVELSISEWTGRKTDPAIADTTANQCHADAGRIKGIKYLVDRKNLKDIITAKNKIRKYHYSVTLPYDQKGKSIISNEVVLDYIKEVGTLKAEYLKTVDDFLQNYAQLKNDAISDLGSLYQVNDFPDIDELRQSFGVEINFSPLPASGNLIIDIAEDQLNELRKDLDNSVKNALEQAQEELYKKTYTVLNNIVEALGNIEKSFKNTLIFNATDLADIIPKINVTGAPEINTIAGRIKTDIGKYTPEEIRQDRAKREEIKNSADSIKTDVSGLIKDTGFFDVKNAPAPVQTPAPAPAAGPVQAPATEPAPEPVQETEPAPMIIDGHEQTTIKDVLQEKAIEPVQEENETEPAPAPMETPEPEIVPEPEPVQAAEPEPEPATVTIKTPAPAADETENDATLRRLAEMGII